MIRKAPLNLKKLAKKLGGKLESVTTLPDGSGAATMSLPLPKNHWLTQPGENVPPMPMRTGTANVQRIPLEAQIRAAGRYALRAATMNGAEEDFDPDALIQNLVVGMLGYCTPTGLSDDPKRTHDHIHNHRMQALPQAF